MFALRQTWNDVFTQPKLFALDLKVNGIDPAWPITAKVAPAIHVNPNCLKTPTEKERQSKLLEKQLALLELKNRKLELEMAKKLAEKQQLTSEPVSFIDLKSSGILFILNILLLTALLARSRRREHVSESDYADSYATSTAFESQSCSRESSESRAGGSYCT